LKTQPAPAKRARQPLTKPCTRIKDRDQRVKDSETRKSASALAKAFPNSDALDNQPPPKDSQDFGNQAEVGAFYGAYNGDYEEWEKAHASEICYG